MSTNSQLVSEADLLDSTGYAHRGHLENWLRDNRIEYWRGKDGKLFTTVGLMEAAKLGGDQGHHPKRAIRFASSSGSSSQKQ